MKMLRLFLVNFWLGTSYKTNVLYHITGESLININILRCFKIQKIEKNSKSSQLFQE